MPDILVVQMERLGDFLQTTPLLSGIKASCPGNSDSCLENSEYLDRDNNDYIYALETGLKLIVKYSSTKYENC